MTTREHLDEAPSASSVAGASAEATSLVGPAIQLSLPVMLLRAREATMRHFRPGFHHFGVTEQQWRILRVLDNVERIEMLGLATASCILAPSLSRILCEMEKKDLIIRKTGESDMRRVFVSITALGRELTRAGSVRANLIYRNITERFGAERLSRLHQLLADLEAELNSMPICEEGLVPRPRNFKGAARRGRPRKAEVQAKV
jgi:homoprotocatechuate degradation regulator HpaR